MDTFEPGQWFHGRIYERRCDLNLDGSLLIYFAQKIVDRTLKDHEYTYAWTAVSKPPYLTALALWPKGDCWHGGGLFQNNKTVVLNHRPDRAEPHPNHLPQGIQVILKDQVHGEDDPIFSERLQRDGWNLRQEWAFENRGYPLMYLTQQPEIWEKFNADGSQFIQLTRSIEELDYSEQFAISSSKDGALISIENASWAEWDHRGRLVFARDGKIYEGWLNNAIQLSWRELVDLSFLKPVTIPAPDWASQW